MAYSETLADRIDGHIGDHPAVVQKKMFGGLAFLLQGNMAVGVSGDDLMVRVEPDSYEQALAEDGVGEFGKMGRPMTGWVLVNSKNIETEPDLGKWVDRGMDFAATLPAK